MAGSKPASKRRRRNTKQSKAELPPTHDGKFPPLPATYWVSDGFQPKRIKFRVVTRQWYEEFCASPQAAAFLDTDFIYLRDVVAPLYDRWMRGGSKEIASELRLQLKDFGGSPSARNSLDWRPRENEQPARAAVSAERRERVLQAVP